MSMAVSSSSVMWKAAWLALLQVVAVTGVTGERHRGGPGGRFLVESDHEFGDVAGRRFLNGNLCGRGEAPDYWCGSLLRGAKQPRCCQTGAVRWCKDVGDDDDFHCGACNNRCGFGRDCCGGTCVDKDGDRNNQPCQRGQCGYNGRDEDD